MEEGRELDARILETIFSDSGYVRIPKDIAEEKGAISFLEVTEEGVQPNGVLPYEYCESGIFFSDNPDDPLHSRVCVAPRFSTDIAAAWQIVERLRERGLVVTISCKPEGFVVWDVRGWNPETNANRFIAHGKTAPEAICLAALRAVEG